MTGFWASTIVTSKRCFLTIFCASLFFGLSYHIRSILLVLQPSSTFAAVEPFYLVLIRAGSNFGFPVYGVDNFSPYPDVRVSQNLFPLGESIYALFLNLLSVDLDALYLYLSIAFSALLFFFVFLTIFNFTNSIPLGLVFAPLIIFFTFEDPYSLQRIISPQFNYLVWIIGIYLLYRSYTLGEIKMATILFLGVSSYISSPYQAFHLLLSFTLLIFFLSYHRTIALRRFFQTWLVLAVFLAPHVLDFSKKLGNDSWSDYLLRMGSIRSRLPSALETVSFAIVTIILLLIYRRQFTLFLPSLILVISILFLSNSNVLTGVTLQTYHFNEMARYLFFLIFSLLVSNFCLLSLLDRFTPGRIRAISLILFILIATYQATKLQDVSSKWPMDQVSRERAQALSMLPKNARVLMDSHQPLFYEAHYNLNFIFTQSTPWFPISTRELAERYFLSNECKTLTREEILEREGFLLMYALLGESQKHEVWRKHLAVFGLQDLIEEPKKSFDYLYKFEKFYKDALREGCGNVLSRYKVDFVILEKNRAKVDWIALLESNSYVRMDAKLKEITVYKYINAIDRSFGS